MFPKKYMKRSLNLFLLNIFVLTVLIKPVFAQYQVAGESAAYEIYQAETDIRVIKLYNFLESLHSPLSPYAYLFIKKADEYGLPDWRLIPAITGVESTFGKNIPFNSYNAYGWVNGYYIFKSWPDSIDVVARTLKEKYYDRRLDTIEKISRVYAPPSDTWADKVNFFINKISIFLPSKTTQLHIR